MEWNSDSINFRGYHTIDCSGQAGRFLKRVLVYLTATTKGGVQINRCFQIPFDREDEFEGACNFMDKVMQLENKSFFVFLDATKDTITTYLRDEAVV